jgi:hypothetical protein
MEAAREKEDEEAERQILVIIQWEKDRNLRQCITYTFGKPWGGTYFKVQAEQGGGMVC